MDFLKLTSNWTTSICLYFFVAIILGLFLYYRATILKFLSEVKIELTKCAWPWDVTQTGLQRYKELTDSTAVVFVSMILLGSYVSIFDFFINRLMNLLVQF